MKKSIVAIIIQILLLSACSTTDMKNEFIPSPAETVTPILRSTRTSPYTTTSVTLVAKTPVPTEVAIPTFEVVRFEHEVEFVDISEQEIPQSTGILVFSEDSYQLFSLVNSQMKMIPIETRGLNFFNGIEFSPNHQWFAYYFCDDNGFHLVVSSFDGSKKYVLQDMKIDHSYWWLNDETIILSAFNDFHCPLEAQLFNPFTGEVKVLNNPFSDISTRCAYNFVYNPDENQALYLSSTGWKTYDYDNSVTEDVLPGVEKSVPGGWFSWDYRGLSFLSLPMDGTIFKYTMMYYGFGLEKDDLTKVIEVEARSLPEDLYFYNGGYIELWSAENQSAFDDLARFDKSNVLDCDEPIVFVKFDFKNEKIINYCLNRMEYNGESLYPSVLISSLDDRFLGWSTQDNECGNCKIQTFIMDTETGKVSVIEGYWFQGFGEITE